MTLLDSALEYCTKGWLVFPCYGIKNGACECGRSCDSPGKHPRLPRGLTQASSDPERIKKWWTLWPSANIGVVTGAKSGIIVVDIDLGADDHDFPETLTAITGGNGKHLIYRHPGDDIKINNTTSVLKHVDSRADGGYIVAPPSNHASGNAYRWLVKNSEINDAPDWWLDSLTIVEKKHSTVVHNTQTSAGSIEVSDLLRIALERYADEGNRNNGGIWLACQLRDSGLTIEESSETIKQYQSQCLCGNTPYTERAALASLKSAYSRPARTPWTVAETNVEKGPIKPKVKIAMPDIIPDKESLIYDIATFILENSIFPQPALAVMAATSFVGTLIGRTHIGATGLTPTVYVCGLAGSGTGKEAARSSISQVAAIADLSQYLGGDMIASGQGIISSLEKHPSRLFMLDEFGYMLQTLTALRAPAHKREIIQLLLSLYSKGNTTFRGSEYADQKTKPRADIIRPCVSLYATSTHLQFWRALSSSEAIDGTLSRLIVIDAGDTRPARQKPKRSTLAQETVERIQLLATHGLTGGNLASRMGGLAGTNDPIVVPMSESVWARWESLDDRLAQEAKDDTQRVIYSRIPENALRLSTIMAVSRNIEDPVVLDSDWEWAERIAMWAADTALDGVGSWLADNDAESSLKRVLRKIQDSGAEGVTARELSRMFHMRTKERREILIQLQEAGMIQFQSVKSESGGRPSEKWFAISD